MICTQFITFTSLSSMASSTSFCFSRFASLNRRLVYDPSGASASRDTRVCSSLGRPALGAKHENWLRWQKPLKKKMNKNKFDLLNDSFSPRRAAQRQTAAYRGHSRSRLCKVSATADSAFLNHILAGIPVWRPTTVP